MVLLIRRAGFCAFLIAAGLSASVQAKSAQEMASEADALQFRGRLTPAVQLYQKALREDANYLPAYLNAAVAYKTLGKNALAAAMLARAAELAPSDPDIRSELGWLYFHDAAFAKALPEFDAALKSDPSHRSAALGRGAALLRLDRPKEAASILKKLSERRPSFAAAHFLLAQAEEKSGDPKEAFEHYLLAVRRDWTFAEARPSLARAYERLRKYEQARQQYDSVLSLDRQNPQAVAGIKGLAQTYKEELSEIRSAPPAPAFTAVEPGVPSEPVRIGIWTNATGQPPRFGGFVFQASQAFEIIGTKSGKIYGVGGPSEPWRVAYLKPGRISLKSPSGKELGPFDSRLRLRLQSSTGTFLIGEIIPWKGSVPSVAAREFRGVLEISFRRGRGLYCVNEVGLEDYLLGVVSSEMPSTWPLEAQKAQAVIARTYAVLRKKRMRPHTRAGYDLCDSQHCQVYRGVRAETGPGSKAVKATAGEGLYDGDALAYSYYFSSCGGHTRSSSESAGWGRSSYLTGRFDSPGSSAPWKTPWELERWLKDEPDAYCNIPELVGSTEFRWLRIVPRDVLERKLGRRYRLGGIKAVTVTGRGLSGRGSEIQITGVRRKAVLKQEHLIRHYLGMDSLRSDLLVIETRRDSKGQPVEFWIYGGGWGHGIGMCQSGAGGLALREKKDYKDILAFYFSGTTVRKIEDR